MVRNNRKIPTRLAQAVEAIDRLTRQGLNEILSGGLAAASVAHTEIEMEPIGQKRTTVYRHFFPLVSELVAAFAENYRWYFKVALHHPHHAGGDPHQWAWTQIQPAVTSAREWIRDWFMLACDGENQYVRPVASIAFVPGQTVSVAIPLTMPPSPPPESWCAPAWLFQVFPGVFPNLKSEDVPATDSEKKLGAAHTRLLLEGARDVFSMALGRAIENVRNQEIANAGATPAETVTTRARGPNRRRGWEQRLKLYATIQKVLSANPTLQGMKFCAELDKRHARPLFDWMESGEWREGLTWKEAWSDPGLRRKIRRVRQEAMKNL